METLSIVDRANTLQESLNKSIPPNSPPHIQIRYLTDLYDSLTTCLLGDVTKNPYFMSGKRMGLQRLMAMRSALSRLMLGHTKALTDIKERHRLPQWNRLMLVWVTLCSVHALLARIDPPANRVDHEGWLEYCELHCPNRQRVADILSYRMSSLRLTLEMLCSRIELLTEVPKIVHYYVSLVEIRCAQFVTGADVVAEDYNVPDWHRLDRTVANNRFVVECMWRLLAVKRQLDTYTTLGKRSFYAKSIGRKNERAEIVPMNSQRATASSELLAAIEPFVRQQAANMNTSDHKRSMKKRLNKYDVFPGDCELHTQLFNKRTVKQATPSQIIGRDRSPTAVEYVRIDKYKREPGEWIDELFSRRELNGPGNHTRGSGAFSEAAHQQAALLHVVNMAFRVKMKITWIEWFVVSQRSSDSQFIVNVLKGIRSGLPFIIQRLGRYACCVPKIPHDRDRTTIEQYINPEMPASDQQQPNTDIVLYECHDVIEAFALWTAWTYYAFDGIVHSKCRITPLLRQILNIGADEQEGDATATQQMLEADL